MEVWVLEQYNPDDSTSDIQGVFENSDVGMNSVNKNHESFIWNEYETFCKSNKVDGSIYYLYKFEVLLDEVPIIKD